MLEAVEHAAGWASREIFEVTKGNRYRYGYFRRSRDLLEGAINEVGLFEIAKILDGPSAGSPTTMNGSGAHCLQHGAAGKGELSNAFRSTPGGPIQGPWKQRYAVPSTTIEMGGSLTSFPPPPHKVWPPGVLSDPGVRWASPAETPSKPRTSRPSLARLVTTVGPNRAMGCNGPPSERRCPGPPTRGEAPTGASSTKDGPSSGTPAETEYCFCVNRWALPNSTRCKRCGNVYLPDTPETPLPDTPRLGSESDSDDPCSAQSGVAPPRHCPSSGGSGPGASSNHSGDFGASPASDTTPLTWSSTSESAPSWAPTEGGSPPYTPDTPPPGTPPPYAPMVPFQPQEVAPAGGGEAPPPYSWESPPISQGPDGRWTPLTPPSPPLIPGSDPYAPQVRAPII